MDWEKRYLEGDTPWEKGMAHPTLTAWLAQSPAAGRIVVPGCGFGHDVRVLAASGAEVLGIDISSSAIQEARSFPPVRGESYIEADFFSPPDDAQGQFDGIFEHTCFCAISPSRRPDYAKAAASLLRPGGFLLAIFFLNPDHDEEGPPFGCTREELDGLFSPDFSLVHELTDIPTFPGREGREILRLLRKN